MYSVENFSTFAIIFLSVSKTISQNCPLLNSFPLNYRPVYPGYRIQNEWNAPTNRIQNIRDDFNLNLQLEPIMEPNGNEEQYPLRFEQEPQIRNPFDNMYRRVPFVSDNTNYGFPISPKLIPRRDQLFLPNQFPNSIVQTNTGRSRFINEMNNDLKKPNKDNLRALNRMNPEDINTNDDLTRETDLKIPNKDSIDDSSPRMNKDLSIPNKDSIDDISPRMNNEDMSEKNEQDIDINLGIDLNTDKISVDLKSLQEIEITENASESNETTLDTKSTEGILRTLDGIEETTTKQGKKRICASKEWFKKEIQEWLEKNYEKLKKRIEDNRKDQ